MFNNIIYFIVALFIFTLNFPDTGRDHSIAVFFLVLVSSWGGLAVSCRVSFSSLLSESPGAPGSPAARYYRAVARLMVLSLVFFFVVVYAGNLKYWLHLLPLFSTFSILEGAAGLGLFLGFLCTVWYFACPAHNYVFQRSVNPKSFVSSNLRLNLPILFPWAVLSLLFDILALDAVRSVAPFMAGRASQMVVFFLVLVSMIIVMPEFIRRWWGCKSLGDSWKGKELVSFLDRSGFRYRGLVRWPIFEGRMMTAGIMGIVPRFRYILVTEALLESLSIDELKGVLAHEMGHARYRHLLVYVFFFVGFIVVSYGLSDLLLAAFLSVPQLFDLLISEGSSGLGVIYLLLSAPVLFFMVLYFRYMVGFFMRQFERQSDLYALEFMGRAAPIIDALEKVAFYAGNSRDLPSWHHFSVRERVDCLLRAERNPGLIRGHNRFVAGCLAVYLICIVSAGYLVNIAPVSKRFHYAAVERALLNQVDSEQADAAAYRALAAIYHESGRYREAVYAYEKALALEPYHPVALNNLAWLLATTPDEKLRDLPRAVILAERAVSVDRNPMFLDTLAEAYYAVERVSEALNLIDEALERAVDNRDYYRKQRQRFLSGK